MSFRRSSVVWLPEVHGRKDGGNSGSGRGSVSGRDSFLLWLMAGTEKGVPLFLFYIFD